MERREEGRWKFVGGSVRERYSRRGQGLDGKTRRGTYRSVEGREKTLRMIGAGREEEDKGGKKVGISL